jgi:hypothetical protein
MKLRDASPSHRCRMPFVRRPFVSVTSRCCRGLFVRESLFCDLRSAACGADRAGRAGASKSSLLFDHSLSLFSEVSALLRRM